MTLIDSDRYRGFPWLAGRTDRRARYLARKASWFCDCTMPVYVRADPVTQLLLRLRNKWRDYCFTILSLGALERGLWLRENIWSSVHFSRSVLPERRTTEQHVS